MVVTINFGEGNTLRQTVPTGTCCRTLLEDENVQAVLGFDSDSVEARVNGRILDINDPLQDEMTLELVRKAGGKSAA
jgi:hypothetical protein